MQSAIAAGTVYPILFGYFDFFGAAVRICTAARSVTWDGQTWTGVGELLEISEIRETKSTRANGLTFSLNGIQSTLIAEVLAYRSRGRECSVWLGSYVSGSLAADPIKLFSGRMDQPTIADSGETCTISVNAESRLADLQRSRERRYTDEDQQQEYPGDLGLQYVAGLQNKEIVWGGNNSTANPAAGMAGGSWNSEQQLIDRQDDAR